MIYNTLALFFGWFLYFLIYVPVVFLWIKGERKLVIRILVNLLVVTVIVKLLKMSIPTARPYTIIGGNPIAEFLLNKMESFPSGHAATSFAIAGTIWDEEHPLGFLVLITALLISIGRVMLNVHYPIDVITGSVIGIIMVVLTKPIIGKHLNRNLADKN